METLSMKCKICSQECVNVAVLKDDYENDSVFEQYLPLIFKYASVQAKDVCNLKCHTCRHELLRTCRFLELMEQSPLLLDPNKQPNDIVVKTELNINNLCYVDENNFGDNQLKDKRTTSEEKVQDIEIIERNFKTDVSDIFNGAKTKKIYKKHYEMLIKKSNLTLGSEKLERQTGSFKDKKRNHIPEKLAINQRTKTLTEIKYICEICKKGFGTFEKLKSHILIHSEKNTFKCDICFKIFSQKCQLKMHYKSHAGEKPFKCKICSKVCSGEDYLQKHEVNHTTLKCNTCSKSRYSSQKLMQLHTAEEKDCSVIASVSDFSNSAKAKKVKQHDKMFIEESNFPLDLEEHIPKKSAIEGRTKELKTYSKLRPPQIKYMCEICNEDFSTYEHLNIHMKFHRNIFKCNICSKSFTQKFRLEIHLLIHAGKRKSYIIHVRNNLTCEICPEIFTSRISLKRHMKINHSNIISNTEKPISTDEISEKHKSEIFLKECGDNDILEEHMKIQTDEKPFNFEVNNEQNTNNIESTEGNINIGNLKQLLRKRMGIEPS